MAPINKANRFTLSVQPVPYDGTDIQPPTPNGGPLTSHPTTPTDIPGAFPYTPAEAKSDVAELLPHRASEATNGRKDSFRSAMSPPAAATMNERSSPTQIQRRPSTGVRKLLSFSSLRSSFGSSRTSLQMPPPPPRPQTQQQNYLQPQQQYNSLKRPSSPSIASTYASYAPSEQQRPELRKKKSGSWFRRKSSMFLRGEEGADAEGVVQLGVVDEGERPETRESKRVRGEESRVPVLPEVGTLRGGRGLVGDGGLGWDENLFGR